MEPQTTSGRRQPRILRHYWIFIIIALVAVIADAGLVAYLSMTEKPTTKKVNSSEFIFGNGSALSGAQTEHTGQIKVWDTPPSTTLQAAYDLLSPLLYIFILVCAIGAGLKIYYDNKEERG